MNTAAHTSPPTDQPRRRTPRRDQIADLPRGLYLPPLGALPPLTITAGLGADTLRLPLAQGLGPPMTVAVAAGAHVAAGALLARDAAGQRLYAPCAGVVGRVAHATVDGFTRRPVLELQLAADQDFTAEPPLPGPEDAPPWYAADPQRRAELTLAALDKAALPIDAQGRTLTPTLRQLRSAAVSAVVANAAPLEPTLNAPLALLAADPAAIYAALGILKTLLAADAAILAYAAAFPVDQAAAAPWRIRPAALGEKYPQALPPVLLHSLRRWCPRPCIFELPLLAQIEKVVMQAKLPLTRVVTVSGAAVAAPGHFRVPIGWPVRALLAQAQARLGRACVVEGASLTGRAVDPDAAVVSALTSGFTVVAAPPRAPAERCIRCGWCLMDCPAGIDPARLQVCAELDDQSPDAARQAAACLECGICSYVCPAGLPLMQSVRAIKRRAGEPSLPRGTVYA